MFATVTYFPVLIKNSTSQPTDTTYTDTSHTDTTYIHTQIIRSFRYYTNTYCTQTHRFYRYIEIPHTYHDTTHKVTINTSTITALTQILHINTDTTYQHS